MSQEQNPFQAPADATNPYAAPVTGSAADFAVDGVEQIRRDHLSHEASIKGMGALYLIGGFFGCLFAVGYFVMGVVTLAGFQQGAEVAIAGVFLIAIALFAGCVGAVQFWTGLGLRRLKPVARIPGIVFSALGLLALPIGTIISAYFMYLLVSQKGTYILSPAYGDVVRQTPHIKYKTSIIVWIFLGLLLFVIGVGIVSLIVGSVR